LNDFAKTTHRPETLFDFGLGFDWIGKNLRLGFVGIGFDFTNLGLG
jgi:hypothetical protein